MSEQETMLTLLYRLLAGSDQLIESVGDWAERLGNEDPSPLVSRFIDQLDDEWYDTLPPDPVCERVMVLARERLSTWHPGWPHTWAHLLRVTGLAVALAEDENVEPTLAFVAGMCHDVAKLDEFRTGEPHEEAGAQFAAAILEGHLRPSQIMIIQDAILKEGDEPLHNILSDADKLDKIGAAGIVRRVSNSTHRTALPTALWRVMDDIWQFPSMHYDLSRELFRHKRVFQTWFLPLAEQAVEEER